MAPAKSMQEILLDKAHELTEQYNNLLEQRAANRRSLRDLATQGLLGEDEIAEVEELYPPRQKRDETDEAGAGE